jgi:hypothetical protein
MNAIVARSPRIAMPLRLATLDLLDLAEAPGGPRSTADTLSAATR